MSLSPTMSLTAAATQMGMVIGTAAYMAPEQARGKPVDKRADVWAFGAVLFEMLAGAKTFAGGDVSEVLATVIKTDPDWDALPDETPFRVRTLLRRCLQKDPKQRVADMQDVRLAMGARSRRRSASRQSRPWHHRFASGSARLPSPHLWRRLW
jgi:serine/threonine protein kinase